MDIIFADSLYWLFNEYTLKTLLLGIATGVSILITLFHIFRKWGDFNGF